MRMMALRNADAYAMAMDEPTVIQVRYMRGVAQATRLMSAYAAVNLDRVRNRARAEQAVVCDYAATTGVRPVLKSFFLPPTGMLIMPPLG